MNNNLSLDATDATDPNPTFRSRFARKAAALVLVPLASLGMVAAFSTAAGANLLPATTSSYRYGDCTLSVGTHPDPNFFAVAGATIACSARHSYTVGTVTLWRWSGSQWVAESSRSATFTNSFGFGNRELDSGRICGGGNAYWTETLSVNIAGLGSTSVGTSVKTFSPGAC